MKRWGVLASCLLVSAVWSSHVNADGLSMDSITWKNIKAELSRLNDWSLGIRRIPKGAKPEIVVNDGVITFNGKILEIGGSLESWKLVLGPEPRAVFDGRILVWDELGVKVALYPYERKKVRTFFVEINCKERSNEPDCLENGGAGNDFDPKHYFSGYLAVEGSAIDNKSTLEEVNRLISGKGRYGRGCGTALCSGFAVKDGRFVSFVDVDSRKFKSIIYDVQFNGGDRGLYDPPLEVSPETDNDINAAHSNDDPQKPVHGSNPRSQVQP